MYLLCLENETMRVDHATTLTVRELIDVLENCEPDAPVFMTASYGDRSRTTQALEILDAVEIDDTWIEDSAYSDSGMSVVDEEYHDGDVSDNAVVILK